MQQDIFWLVLQKEIYSLSIFLQNAKCYVNIHAGTAITVAVSLSQSERACPLLTRGGDAMNISFTELYQFCMIILGIVSLFIQAKKK